MQNSSTPGNQITAVPVVEMAAMIHEIAKSDPNCAIMICVHGKPVPNDSAVVQCSYIMNPEGVVMGLLTEAMRFNRVDDVKKFIEVARRILDTTEANIDYQSARQSVKN